MAEENTAPSPDNSEAAPVSSEKKSAKPAAEAKSAAAPKAKKEKPPALEDKPFSEFIEQHFVPELEQALKKEGWEPVELKFENSQITAKGADPTESYWQVRGLQRQENNRQFSIIFSKEDISSPKYFYCSLGQNPASTVEQFMGDERKITLDLLLLYTLQRLNGQKWLTRN